MNDAYRRLYNKPCPGFNPASTGDNLRQTVFFSPMLNPEEPMPWRSYGWHSRLQLGGAEPSRVILLGDSQKSSNLDYKKVNYRNNGKALNRLRNVVGRLESSWRPATAEEGFEIVRRRLFEPLAGEQFKNRDVTARASDR